MLAREVALLPLRPALCVLLSTGEAKARGPGRHGWLIAEVPAVLGVVVAVALRGRGTVLLVAVGVHNFDDKGGVIGFEIRRGNELVDGRFEFVEHLNEVDKILCFREDDGELMRFHLLGALHLAELRIELVSDFLERDVRLHGGYLAVQALAVLEVLAELSALSYISVLFDVRV